MHNSAESTRIDETRESETRPHHHAQLESLPRLSHAEGSRGPHCLRTRRDWSQLEHCCSHCLGSQAWRLLGLNSRLLCIGDSKSLLHSTSRTWRAATRRTRRGGVVLLLHDGLYDALDAWPVLPLLLCHAQGVRLRQCFRVLFGLVAARIPSLLLF